MKAPVFLASTMELIGVVDVDPSMAATLRQQRYYRFAIYPGLPSFAAYSAQSPIASFTVEQGEFRCFSVRGSTGAETMCLTVEKKRWLEGWPRRLWPRTRPKRNRRRKSYSANNLYQANAAAMMPGRR